MEKTIGSFILHKIFNKSKNKKDDSQLVTHAKSEQGFESVKKIDCFNFDPLMTGQLVALYKTTHNKDYANEYERRLKHIGFTESETKNLFMFELMTLKHDHVQMLIDRNYLADNYFNLKNCMLPQENLYYIEHQIFSVSEITKIWDEAECIWSYRKNEEMPNDVASEIFEITRYGGGELFVETLKSISQHSNIDFSKIQKYSLCEQDLLFKYKWNKSGNEKHPFYN